MAQDRNFYVSGEADSYDSQTCTALSDGGQTDVKSPIVTLRKFGKEIEVSSADGNIKIGKVRIQEKYGREQGLSIFWAML